MIGNESISILQLSVRSYNSLTQNSIYTIKDLLSYTPHELILIRNLGQKSYNEIIDSVGKLLSLNTISKDLKDIGLKNYGNYVERTDDYGQICIDNKKLSSFGLSVRSINCLTNNDILTVADLLSSDFCIISNLHSCGQNTIIEINKKVKEFVADYNISDELRNRARENFSLSEFEYEKFSENVKIFLEENRIKSLDAMIDYADRVINDNTITETLKQEYDNDLVNIINNDIRNKRMTSKINKIPYICLNTDIDELPISCSLKSYLKNENGYKTLGDLLEIEVIDNKYLNFELKQLIICVNNIVESENSYYFSPSVYSSYILCPFDLEKTESIEYGEYVEMSFLLEYLNSDNISLNDKFNIKLLFCWLIHYADINVKDYYIAQFGLNDREIEILGKRVYLSLEEIGQLMNLTRERVRQIQAKSIKKMDIYDELPFRKIMNHDIYILEEQSYIDLTFINLAIYKDHTLELCKINAKDVAISTKYIDEINKLLQTKSDLLSTNGYIYYELEENSNVELFNISASKIGIKYVNNHLFYNMPGKKMVGFAMKHIDRPIHISEKSDLTLIANTVEDLFGVNLLEVESDRGIVSLIEKAGVRIDSGIYSYSDKVIPLDNNELKEIVDYVKENKIINTRDLFGPFGQTLIAHNLDNSSILYRYLKEELFNTLYFAGVSEVISISKDFGAWGTVIQNYIKEVNRPVKKAELMIKFAITPVIFAMLCINFDNIISYGESTLYLKGLIDINPEIKEAEYENLITMQIVDLNEYFSYFQKNYGKILEHNHIKNIVAFSYFVEYIFCDENLKLNRETYRLIYIKNSIGNKREKSFDSSIKESSF